VCHYFRHIPTSRPLKKLPTFLANMAEVPTVGSSGECITYKYPPRISGFDLGAEIGRLVESSLAVDTRDAYQTGILSFETFRVDYGLAQI
jgi:hypothetical protein